MSNDVIYRYDPVYPQKAILHASYTGPCFEFALAIGAHDLRMLNAYLNGRCFTKGSSNYDIDEDDQGRSALTGSNARNEMANQSFTVAKLEVYLVITREEFKAQEDNQF